MADFIVLALWRCAWPAALPIRYGERKTAVLPAAAAVQAAAEPPAAGRPGQIPGSRIEIRENIWKTPAVSEPGFSLFCIRLLPLMGFPHTFCDLHIRENGFE